MSKTKNILILMLVAMSSVIHAQHDDPGHSILDKFNVYEVGGTVYISCIISAGRTCNGIDVLRSEDSLIYKSVGHIDGVCGNSYTPVPYNFTDKNPIKNKPSYYKLELGGYGYSEALSINIIDTKAFGFQVRPNPARERTVIYFDNDFNDDYELTLFNANGSKVVTKVTSTNQFPLELSAFKNGIYFFIINKINATQDPVQGKLMIQH